MLSESLGINPLAWLKGAFERLGAAKWKGSEKAPWTWFQISGLSSIWAIYITSPSCNFLTYEMRITMFFQRFLKNYLRSCKQAVQICSTRCSTNATFITLRIASSSISVATGSTSSEKRWPLQVVSSIVPLGTQHTHSFTWPEEQLLRSRMSRGTWEA